MRTVWMLCVVCLCAGLLVVVANAEVLENVSGLSEPGQWGISGGLGRSSTAYDVGDVDRTLVGLSGSYGITDRIDAFGTLAVIPSAEADGWGGDGSGFCIALGARGDIMPVGPVNLQGYCQLQHIREDYGTVGAAAIDTDIFGFGLGASESVDLNGQITELLLGVLASYDPLEALSLYGALELIPVSRGEVEYEYTGTVRGFGLSLSESASETEDASRDRRVTLRVGALYDFVACWVRAELAVVGETTFLLGAGKSF